MFIAAYKNVILHLLQYILDPFSVFTSPRLGILIILLLLLCDLSSFFCFNYQSTGRLWQGWWMTCLEFWLMVQSSTLFDSVYFVLSCKNRDASFSSIIFKQLVKFVLSQCGGTTSLLVATNFTRHFWHWTSLSNITSKQLAQWFQVSAVAQPRFLLLSISSTISGLELLFST